MAEFGVNERQERGEASGELAEIGELAQAKLKLGSWHKSAKGTQATGCH